jgi:hypothetical protein
MQPGFDSRRPENIKDMEKKFQRTIEDFVCGHCGDDVTGNGYTNHCPKCLWSKHVDIHPGDRAETCGGMMKPISVIKTKGDFSIIHQCEKCGFEKKNKLAPEDNFDEVVRLSKGESE